LLDEYLETSWFINGKRKLWAQTLIENVKQATSINGVIEILSQSQISAAAADINENKKRSGKSLHFFGESRYQTTLSRAINLTASLAGKTDLLTLKDGLQPLMEQVTDEQPMQTLTHDAIQNKATVKKSDRANASVIGKALENTLWIENRRGPTGMIGRVGLFDKM